MSKQIWCLTDGGKCSWARQKAAMLTGQKTAQQGEDSQAEVALGYEQEEKAAPIPV